ncbi:hypothetical protein [Piscinibacter sakaiensis]|uniref:hypothetical protein n=1 Tax=Piscinibacter sakaiensis TaxID=1547922 RepID=UPI003AABE7AC
MPAGSAATVSSVRHRRRAAPGLLAAIAVSAAAHAALFGFADVFAGSSAPAHVVAPSSRLLLRVAAAPPTGNERATHSGAADTEDPARPFTSVNDAGPLSAPEPVADSAVAMAQPQQPSDHVDTQRGAAIGVDGYLPRSDLSQPPLPIGDIELHWPRGIYTLERQVATFWMFVDESGIVRRFEPDGPTLAPVLEETARRTFMAARFDPGQRDGRPVKSLIRIEVVFDNRPSDAAAPTIVAERIL